MKSTQKRPDDLPVYWELTLEGRNCRCNTCNTQFYDQGDFARHWKACPVRQKWGYIEPVISSPS